MHTLHPYIGTVHTFIYTNIHIDTSTHVRTNIHIHTQEYIYCILMDISNVGNIQTSQHTILYMSYRRIFFDTSRSYSPSNYYSILSPVLHLTY